MNAFSMPSIVPPVKRGSHGRENSAWANDRNMQEGDQKPLRNMLPQPVCSWWVAGWGRALTPVIRVLGSCLLFIDSATVPLIHNGWGFGQNRALGIIATLRVKVGVGGWGLSVIVGQGIKTGYLQSDLPERTRTHEDPDDSIKPSVHCYAEEIVADLTKPASACVAIAVRPAQPSLLFIFM